MCENAKLDASEIDIVVVSGEVTLTAASMTGRTSGWPEDLSEGVSGVREVHNQLRIAPDSREQSPEPPSPPGEPPRYRAA
jgi:osmotically-inducible protein OsmY